MAKSNYVVYFHRHPITNEVFYVGMGTGRRPYNFTRRSEEYKTYMREHGNPVVELVRSGLTKTEACVIEIEYIRSIGRKSIGSGKLLNVLSGSMSDDDNPVPVRLPRDLYDEVKELAEEESRSMSNMIKRLLKQALISS